MATQLTQGTTKPSVLPQHMRSPVELSAFVKVLERRRSTMEAEWRLNLSFYRGKQYAVYDPITRRINNLPTEEGQKPRYRVRLTSNQIGPGVRANVAKMLKTRPITNATPTDGSPQKMKAAEMANDLIEQWDATLGLEAKKEEAVSWSRIAGQGYWKLSYDPNAGVPCKYMVNPQTGEPIQDESLKTLFESEIEKMGLDPQMMYQTLLEGDIKVEVLSPFDVFLDTSVGEFEDMQYVICRHHLTPSEIQTRWNRTVDADALPSSPDQSLPYSSKNSSAEAPVLKAVFIGYFKPSASLPKGRYVVWADGVEGMLEDKPWPYQSRVLPIFKFPGKRVPGSVYDDPIVSDARPMQKELNRSISQMIEFKNMTIRPRIWAPVNSLMNKVTTEPGTVNFYSPVNGQRPEFEQPGSLPAYLLELIQMNIVRIKEIFGLTDMDFGKVPPNIEAGIAIDLLQEQSWDQFSAEIMGIERTLEKAYNFMLGLGQQFYDSPRLLKVAGSSGADKERYFKGADLNGVTIRVEAGSGLPRTRAGRQARILAYVEKGLIDPKEAHRYDELGDLKIMAKQFEAHQDRALRENEKMIRGEPLNPLAVQQLQQQAMQLLQAANAGDENAAMQLQDMGDPQAAMMNAALQPLMSDDNSVHMETHDQLIVSAEFEALPLEVQSAIMQHRDAHLQALINMPHIPEPIAPRVSYQIKATTGPTTGSKILERAGVLTTPEEMAEPPLETWISDSTDKPDDPNAHTAQLEHERELAAQGDQQALAMQAQEHQMMMAEAQGGAQDAQTVQKMRHAEEMHQARLATQQAQTEATRKAANRQPSKGGN